MGLLADLVVFQEMPPPARARLEAAGTVLDLGDGAQVFTRGDSPDAVYAIVGGTGSVRIGAIDHRGKGLMVEVFRTGDLFGEIGVLDGGKRTADAVVTGRLRAMRIGAAAFLTTLAATPELGVALSRVLARRIRRTFDLFQDAAFEPLAVRLARQLLYLADLYGRETESGVRLAGRFRQPDLADLLGTTPRSIITILNAWRARGLLTYNVTTGQIVIARDRLLGEVTIHDDSVRRC